MHGGSSSHKEINRTNLSQEQIEATLEKDVVSRHLSLLRMRNTCRAFSFGAAIRVAQPEKHILRISWEKDGAKAVLMANFKTLVFSINADMPQGMHTFEQR